MRLTYRDIPKVDMIVSDQSYMDLIDRYGRKEVVKVLQNILEQIRTDLSTNTIIDSSEVSNHRLHKRVKEVLKIMYSDKLRKVVNATGVVLHTNLGRAPISESVISKAISVVKGYCNLEIDIEKGVRGSRQSHIKELLRRVTGCEDSLVVNNNASAVMLCLKALSDGKEAIVSRGQLVEIGGSFRIPEVMEQSNVKLVEVGTTNKTHLSDYENAITEDTRLVLKVHTSNYKIIGFTSEVSAFEIANFCKKRELISLEDLGSGVLVDLSKYGLSKEPTVQDSLKSGIDLVTISGDKLFGGPQAGIILGKKHLIDRIQKHPLYRALRVDKIILSVLEETIKCYLNEESIESSVPVFKMLSMSLESTSKRSNLIIEELAKKTKKIIAKCVLSYSYVGGGSLPGEGIPSYVVSLTFTDAKISNVQDKLRFLDIPIICRLSDDALIIDSRTIMDEEIAYVIDSIIGIVEGQ